ncbi:MAG: glucose 1-dehydrogenase [Alphaproteobacteria bacterium]|nr:glucose 1-dehydrogenase [Alphaproteobacteria bacterium]
MPHDSPARPLDGKVALVTGAARGIGAATARRLAAAGAWVALTDVLEKEGKAAAAAIVAAGGTAMFLRHDVASEADWERVIAETMAEYGGLHVLVNNAGIFRHGRLEDMALADWHAVAAVNLDGVLLGTKHAVRAMKESGGAIVNISSMAAMIGSAFSTGYSMSKGGVRSFTKAAAIECAELGYPIRVNSVHPGVIDTEMAGQVVEKFTAHGRDDDPAVVRERMRAAHPAGRLGTADDIARAVVFLACDDSAFMTGAELVVDGGFTAR